MEGVVSQFAGIYREWAPHASLRGHVRCLWINDLSRSRTEECLQVVPDGCADIVWTGETLCIAGPDTRPILARMPCGAIIAGVRFHPGAASAWLGQPLSEIVNVRVPLAEFWGDDATGLLDRAAAGRSAKQLAEDLEAFLVGRLAAVGLADPRIAFLRRAAGDNRMPAGQRLDQLAAHVGLSERTLRRRCVDAFGYGFKTLDRVLRFQRFFRLASRPENHNLADMAAHAGYADQAHMTREVRRIRRPSAGQVGRIVQDSHGWTRLASSCMKRLRRIVHRAAVIGLLSCACCSRVAIAAGTQTATVESRTITVRIDRPFDNVYDFLVDPANWNQWAFGLGRNIRRSTDGWIADSGGGIVRVQFTARNTFGVVDHTVIRPSGQRVNVPMRLIANSSGCELLFTLFREANMSDAQFASDAGFVERDLNGLKRLLEK